MKDRPIRAFLGGAAGMIGGAALGSATGTLLGSELLGTVVASVAILALTVLGYAWGGGR